MNVLFSAGIIFLGSLLMMRLSSRFRLPSVTGYLIFGVLIGPYVFNLVSPGVFNLSGYISQLALSFIAFTLGQNFTLINLQRIGKAIITISIFEVFGASALVTLATWLIVGIDFPIALVFGAVAAATAPAAVVMVTREFKARGEFTDTLLGIVAIDDAWGIILFALCLAIAQGMVGMRFLQAVSELIGSGLIGVLFGLLLSRISRWLKTANELVILTTGTIVLNAGVATICNFSILLANMIMGATVVNLDRASGKFFESVRRIDFILYLLFFVLAGAHLDIPKLLSLSGLGIIYIIARLLGKILGSFVGATIIRSEKRIRNYIGLGLAPQAGVALGLALIAFHEFPGYGDMILSTIIVTTIIYEI
ncbi:hypothetical protein DRP53_08750, partial [candidate division WOR-3 bacterium]